VEQSTQLSAVVHKRLHTAQAQEFTLLKECVAEHPEAICAVIPNPAKRWMGKLEFDSVDLIPAADPNVPSQVHRVMLATALVQMAATNPDIYNKFRAHQRAWKTVGLSDTNDFLVEAPPPPPPQPDPAHMMAAQAQATKAQADMVNAQGKVEDSKRKAAGESVQVAAQAQKAQTDAQAAQMNNSAKAQQMAVQLQTAQIEAETERLRMAAEANKVQNQQLAPGATIPGQGIGP